MRENVEFYDTCLAVSMSGDEKCDLRCQLRNLRGTTHVCEGSLYLPACHRHYPPPPTLSSPQETILTMCVACAKCARFLFPEIGPILNTTPNLRTKQTDIRF